MVEQYEEHGVRKRMTANSSDERAKKPKIAEGEEQQGDGLAHKMENGHVNKTPIDDEKEKKKPLLAKKA